MVREIATYLQLCCDCEEGRNAPWRNYDDDREVLLREKRLRSTKQKRQERGTFALIMLYLLLSHPNDYLVAHIRPASIDGY